MERMEIVRHILSHPRRWTRPGAHGDIAAVLTRVHRTTVVHRRATRGTVSWGTVAKRVMTSREARQ